MIRVMIETIGLFLLPFAAFAAFLIVRRRQVTAVENWSQGSFWLTATGLLLILGSFLYSGFAADRPQRGFEPTRVENGRIVPGTFR